MQPEAAKYLYDIRQAAALVLDQAAGVTPEQYEADALVRSLIERQLIIIGEAVRQLSRRDPQTAQGLADHEKIVGLRNVLVHGYDLVDAALITRVVRDRLPALLHEARTLLQIFEDPDEPRPDRSSGPR